MKRFLQQKKTIIYTIAIHSEHLSLLQRASLCMCVRERERERETFLYSNHIFLKKSESCHAVCTITKREGPSFPLHHTHRHPGEKERWVFPCLHHIISASPRWTQNLCRGPLQENYNTLMQFNGKASPPFRNLQHIYRNQVAICSRDKWTSSLWWSHILRVSGTKVQQHVTALFIQS